MEETPFAERKSRLIHQRADRKSPEWRAVGSVTIVAPELDRPLFLDGVGYTVFFQEAKKEGELRDAVIILNRLKRPSLAGSLFWCFLWMFFGAAMMRAWILLS